MGMCPKLKLCVCCTEGAPLRWQNRWSGRTPIQTRTLGGGLASPENRGNNQGKGMGWQGVATFAHY
jgi:hypothetical protein